MFGRINTFKKLALAAVVAGATFIPMAAFAGDRGDRYRHHDHNKGRFDVSIGFGGYNGGFVRPPACEPIWVAPVYRTECERVWAPPVYRNECGRVWVEPVYGFREVVRWDCGRRIVVRERVLVSAGYWQTTSQQVLVSAGHWETRERQVLVRDGYWASAPVPASSQVVFNFGYHR